MCHLDVEGGSGPSSPRDDLFFFLFVVLISSAGISEFRFFSDESKRHFSAPVARSATDARLPGVLLSCCRRPAKYAFAAQFLLTRITKPNNSI